jgi:hypothetical protein
VTSTLRGCVAPCQCFLRARQDEIPCMPPAVVVLIAISSGAIMLSVASARQVRRVGRQPAPVEGTRRGPRPTPCSPSPASLDDLLCYRRCVVLHDDDRDAACGEEARTASMVSANSTSFQTTEIAPDRLPCQARWWRQAFSPLFACIALNPHPTHPAMPTKLPGMHTFALTAFFVNMNTQMRCSKATLVVRRQSAASAAPTPRTVKEAI